MEELTIQDVRRIRLNKGDVLLIRFPDTMLQSEMAYAMEAVENTFPNNRCLGIRGSDVELEVVWSELDSYNKDSITKIAKQMLSDLQSKDWEFSWVMDKEGNTNIAVTGFYRNDEGIWEEYIVCEAPNDEDNNFGRFEDMELISNAPRLIRGLLQRIEKLERDNAI